MVMEEWFLEWPESRISVKARKQVFQTSESLAASQTTKSLRLSKGGFSDLINEDRVQTSLR